MTIKRQLTIAPLIQDDLDPVSRLFEKTIADAFEREGLGHLHSDILQEVETKIEMANASLNPQCTGIWFWVAKMNGIVTGTISYAP